MRLKVKLLPLTVGITSFSIVVAVMMVIIGIFDEWLNWDIFSPQLEKILYAIFGSTIALAGFGICLTIVLGIMEIITTLKTSNSAENHGKYSENNKQLRKANALFFLLIVFFIGSILGTLHITNYKITIKRNNFFKELAKTQVTDLNDQLSKLRETLLIKDESHIPMGYYDILQTLENQSYINRATLYFPDQQNEQIVWEYRAVGYDYERKERFVKFYVIRDYEKAISAALSGKPKSLDNINEKAEFIWYHRVVNNSNVTVAILRIAGNRRENFREF